MVTFFKSPFALELRLPHRRAGRDFRIISATDREVFSVTDMTTDPNPDIMSWLDQQFGKAISSRTWLTLTRIRRRMG